MIVRCSHTIRLLTRLYDTKESMKKELVQMDKTLESLRKEFKPSQISHFIMNIQKNQNRDSFKEAFNKFFGEVQPIH